MSGNQKPGGYDAAFYYTPEANIQNAQLIVSQVGEDTNWKMCIDAIVNARTEAKVGIKHRKGSWDIYFHSYLSI